LVSISIIVHLLLIRKWISLRA